MAPTLAAADLRALAETDITTAIPLDQLGPVITSSPFVAVPGTFNTRDLGLVPTSAGQPTPMRQGFAFRSGGLTDGRASAALGSTGLGIRRVFDIRSQKEHADKPDPAVEGAEGVWAPTSELDAVVRLDEFVEGQGEGGYVWMYLDVLRCYRPAIKAVLEHVRDRPAEPFLFHCTAGRDRTGVVAGLLMTLAGVDADTVAFDYLLSRLGMEPAREQLLAFALHGAGVTSIDAPGFKNMTSLRKVCWDAYVEAVNREYGGFEKFITDILGLSAEDVEIIKHNLTVAPSA
ncbi:uncharacterized protein E0L32_006239 [Thyridium curvatum]|uniref:Tyrosine specific protein phosphatases domain-containing protein n=1 Tax=Thyridium curvatum TaxID=1093900 RepID=A0A507B2G1_9PEZI|nr:uncharacterized protein E0L32_006239 [Thyridium curvatum]TPX13266.1 hypothetical protein E0L32_006239 [Thyridium curvatum]